MRRTHPVENMAWVPRVAMHAATTEAFLAAALGVEALRAL
jgi:hypothetical protein